MIWTQSPPSAAGAWRRRTMDTTLSNSRTPAAPAGHDGSKPGPWRGQREKARGKKGQAAKAGNRKPSKSTEPGLVARDRLGIRLPGARSSPHSPAALQAQRKLVRSPAGFELRGAGSARLPPGVRPPDCSIDHPGRAFAQEGVKLPWTAAPDRAVNLLHQHLVVGGSLHLAENSQCGGKLPAGAARPGTWPGRWKDSRDRARAAPRSAPRSRPRHHLGTMPFTAIPLLPCLPKRTGLPCSRYTHSPRGAPCRKSSPASPR